MCLTIKGKAPPALPDKPAPSSPAPSSSAPSSPAPSLSKTDSPSPLATGRALILLQLLSRALTFILNQGLVRHAPPAVFGTAAIQFDLVAATILFLSREGVRNAVLRSSTSIISIWAFRLGFGVALATVTLYLSTAPLSTTAQPYFHLSLALYVVGALFELLVEPLYIRATRGDLKVRVAAEGGQAVVRTALSFALLVALSYFGDNEGRGALLGLAVGYWAGSAWLAARYLWAYGRAAALPDLLFAKKGEGADLETRRLAIAGTRQSVVKHLLTEADRIAVGYISPLGDQGGYAIAMNYGSLIARIIFQPLEETLRLHWSRSLTAPATLPLLTFAVRASLHLMLLFPIFLPPLLPAVLPLLLPRKYTAETNAAGTLQTYLTVYLPLLSLNGILESFHAASATPAQMSEQAWVMGGSSAAFVLALWRLSGMVWFTREQALIYASCAAMLVRIGYAGFHAWRFARTRTAVLPVLPRPAVLVGVGAAGVVTWAAAAQLGEGLRNNLALLGVGAIAGLSVLATIFAVERADVRQLAILLKAKGE
ncbi:uncharacterized protein CcaverHIS019_0401250 [Cutaneotrichosporon cavernicola]|uniref:Man(5)GlcNAc(2)-PP-dolichol translocation protein RFT1 n=1 Tax=Cutaneotrichosporon cavernicola TaxID=279322 RepID=A0AA48QVG3_9TREE|nr:uncharacterized protein CcaverHIS019_0401250 [Cutaneotrichosporon cavernicola]BEI91305.1 hypothetical protein CcaverHIS019_0401250 [Cutaneotrichosporon cavernicola]BEJ06852.1 hypothetical protein CcaverHIS641_0401210 [Cutaneotrichosporon cavernicola]